MLSFITGQFFTCQETRLQCSSPTGEKLFFKFKTLVVPDLIVAILLISLTYVKQQTISKRKLDYNLRTSEKKLNVEEN